MASRFHHECGCYECGEDYYPCNEHKDDPLVTTWAEKCSQCSRPANVLCDNLQWYCAECFPQFLGVTCPANIFGTNSARKAILASKVPMGPMVHEMIRPIYTCDRCSIELPSREYVEVVIEVRWLVERPRKNRQDRYGLCEACLMNLYEWGREATDGGRGEDDANQP